MSSQVISLASYEPNAGPDRPGGRPAADGRTATCTAPAYAASSPSIESRAAVQAGLSTTTTMSDHPDSLVELVEMTTLYANRSPGSDWLSWAPKAMPERIG